MSEVRLAGNHLRQIRDEGAASYPHECCGVLLGSEREGVRRVVELLPATNEFHGSTVNRFLISPETYRRADEYARQKELDILGFYHSHPDAPARPSQYDLDHAWPWYSYIIISIEERRPADMTGWQLKEDRSGFTQEAIVTIDQETGELSVWR